MSESQKVWTSLAGTVVAHLLLLVLVFTMLSFRRVSLPSRAASAAMHQPREVLVAIGDLLEQARLEEPEPEIPDPPAEPDALEEPAPAPRPFMATDLNAPEAAAPAGARFESDRNTSAATEIAPDRNAPQQSGAPTTVGDRPTPHLALANREFVDGPLDQVGSAGGGGSPAAPAPPPAPAETPAPAEAPSPPAGSANPAGETGLLMNAEIPQSLAGKPSDPNPATAPAEESGSDAETLVTKADRPPEQMVGDVLARPAGSRPDGIAPEEMRSQSFVDPAEGSGAAAFPGKVGAEDTIAKREETESEVGPATDLAASTMAAAAPGTDGKDEEEIVSDGPPPSLDAPVPMTAATSASTPPPPAPAPALASADDGLFAEGMSPEERFNMINGDTTRIGQNAVDAEATEMGRYKKSVNDVIKQRWHRYRQDRGADVSWGVLKLRFRVDANGRVSALTVVENKADTALVELSMRAIVDSKLPPMPAAVATEVGSEGLEIQYDIIIY
jgi:hypothetical protein